MKNRTLPYGYCYQNGIIEVHTQESGMLRKIVTLYLNGLSLLKIAEQLNESNIEFMPGVVGWNKARLARIITDARYTGVNGYPVIINQAELTELRNLKAEKNNQKDLDRSADIFSLDVPVLCGLCGQPMQRFHEKRTKCHERWTCRNPECKAMHYIADNTFLRQLAELMNTVINNPCIIKSENNPTTESSMDILRIENEIGRMLDSVNTDKEILRKKILECTSMKYKAIHTTNHLTRRLRMEYEKYKPLTQYSAELFRSTVKSVMIGDNGSISLVLLNGQRIGKEQDNDGNSTDAEENSTPHTAKRA